MSDYIDLSKFQSTPHELFTRRSNKTGCSVTGMAAEFEPFGDCCIANSFEFFRRACNEKPRELK